MSVRAKLKCSQNIEMSDRAFQVNFHAVYSEDLASENKKWADATPTANLNMVINNPDAAKQFIAGQEYYVDFTPVS